MALLQKDNINKLLLYFKSEHLKERITDRNKYSLNITMRSILILSVHLLGHLNVRFLKGFPIKIL
jgi:hypothetical protein